MDGLMQKDHGNIISGLVLSYSLKYDGVINYVDIQVIVSVQIKTVVPLFKII